MNYNLEPLLLPWFAPLPEPMIVHLLQRLERTRRAVPATALQVLFNQVRDKRAATYFYMDPFVQARLNGGPAALSFSTGWLLKTLGAQAPGKKEAVSQKTLSYWRSKGLVRFQQHGLPDYASAAALYLARIIDVDAERHFLPSSMGVDEQDWWCFTQAAPDAPVVPWQASLLQELPSSTFCWTPWLGSVWEPGWIKRQDQTFAMRWARIEQKQPLAYHLWPEDVLSWYPFGTLSHLDDPDILQSSALLLLHHLARRRKELFASGALPEDIQSVEVVLAKGGKNGRLRAR